MTNEQIRNAVAKIEGWENKSLWYPCDITCDCDPQEGHWKDTETPHYTNSYDAILPVIQKQDRATRTGVVLHLTKAQNNTARCFEFLDSTPLELCIALLKAKGLYEN